MTSELDQLCKEYGSGIEVLLSDIADLKAIESSIRRFVDRAGFPEFCICNAGMRARCSIKKSTIEYYSEVMTVNAFSQIFITKLLADLKISRTSYCQILYITSIVGQRGFRDLSVYATSKSALEGFCRSASNELADYGIRINCLAPGFVSSSYAESFKECRPELYDWTIERTPLGRWGTCEEIADMVYFLVSKNNSFMTGSIVNCDGGWTASA